MLSVDCTAGCGHVSDAACYKSAQGMAFSEESLY